MLVLFDIDATLLKTSRAGLHAMADAARDLVGREFRFEGVTFAGGLDPIIITQILNMNAHDADAEFLNRFRA
ncbi:MAG: hypothetical protein KDB53_10300, partial [Planctomycetes bacterium]|nr:hypothetical protein [Planctomycetota bacterium]